MSSPRNNDPQPASFRHQDGGQNMRDGEKRPPQRRVKFVRFANEDDEDSDYEPAGEGGSREVISYSMNIKSSSNKKSTLSNAGARLVSCLVASSMLESSVKDNNNRNSSTRNVRRKATAPLDTDIIASECLDALCLRRIVSFLNVSGWLRARKISCAWRDACDAEGFKAFFWKAPESLLKAKVPGPEQLGRFLAMFGASVRAADLSACRAVRLPVLNAVLDGCPALEYLRVFSLTGSPSFKAVLERPGLQHLILHDAVQFSPSATAVRTWMAVRAPSATSARTGTEIDESETPLADSDDDSNSVVGNGLVTLRLMNACHIKPSDCQALFSPDLKKLFLSNCKGLGNAVFTALRTQRPQLDTLALREINALSLSRVDLRRSLASFAFLLRTLDLSGSIQRDVWPEEIHLPALENLFLDRTALHVAPLLRDSLRLRVLSMERCILLGDEQFNLAIEAALSEDEHEDGKPFSLCNLFVARLSGTRVSESSVEWLQNLPKLRVLQLDSCRNCPRSLRLAAGKKYAAVSDLAQLAPELMDLAPARTFIDD